MTADQVRCTKFFDELLPVAVRDRADLFDQGPGTLAVFVEGAGCWTVSFGNHADEGAVAEGAGFDADCVAVFTVPMFDALLSGKAAGSPVVIGDERLLARLGQLLIPPARGGVAARLRNT